MCRSVHNEFGRPLGSDGRRDVDEIGIFGFEGNGGVEGGADVFKMSPMRNDSETAFTSSD